MGFFSSRRDLVRRQDFRVPGGAAVFDVKILYREPRHERWSGGGPREPFVALYRGITASSHREAVRIAENRFEETARASRVAWPREVVEVRVRPQA
jgi:hypothetical protein